MDVGFDQARVDAIGRALAAVPSAVYAVGGRVATPRPVLPRLCEFRPPFGVLTGLALALSNYQLGSGGSPQYWRDASDELDRHEPIAGINGARTYMQALMRHPSASRLARTKLARVDRLLASDLPAWIGERSIDDLGHDCTELWDRLGAAMRQTAESKTIVYAMRTFDNMHRIATGDHVAFPVAVPIVVDLRIGRVSLASGLMGVVDPGGVLRLMEDGNRYVARNKRSILAAWTAVSKSAGGLSLFRIDGLMWEVGETIHRERHRRTDAQRAVAVTLTGHGADEQVAKTVATELTHALPDI